MVPNRRGLFNSLPVTLFYVARNRTSGLSTSATVPPTILHSARWCSWISTSSSLFKKPRPPLIYKNKQTKKGFRFRVQRISKSFVSVQAVIYVDERLLRSAKANLRFLRQFDARFHDAACRIFPAHRANFAMGVKEWLWRWKVEVPVAYYY